MPVGEDTIPSLNPTENTADAEQNLMRASRLWAPTKRSGGACAEWSEKIENALRRRYDPLAEPNRKYRGRWQLFNAGIASAGSVKAFY